ncbi:MAG TPA: class I SAM-dependent RNA methyltransferase [Rectinemataceae bacterium]|nr:class I SAM-dependent RNA methyltransferase [Rectinemataceae bacterium]
MAGDGRVTLDIEKLVAGGEGIAFHEGRAVFVPFVLPGERVEARIVEERRDYARAELLAVLAPSADRVDPECPLFGLCGGCGLQHAGYSAQLAAKQAFVREIFRRGAGFDPGLPRIVASKPYGYRNRVQFHLDGQGRVGYMKRDSEELVAVASCPIADPAIETWLAEHGGPLREELRPFIGNATRFIVYGAEGASYLEGRHRRVSVGVLGERIFFDIEAFFQSNLGILGELVEAALAGIEGGTAADLYAGVGLFGHFLAKGGARVVMVEQDARSLAEARKNVVGPVHQWHAQSVDEWCRGPGARARFDSLVVDPPRSGLSPALRSWILRSRPPQVSYVSCDPVTLARDAKELVAGGYRLDSLVLFDFYPQTGHVESLARFVPETGS